MAIEIGRIKVVSNGWIGAPGLSQLYFAGSSPGTVTPTDCANAAAAVRTLYDAVKGFFPAVWSAQVDPVVQVIEATTGAIIREQGISAITVVAGTGGGDFGPTATGMVLSWHTSSVFGRKLLRGRTFMTPLRQTSYNSQGHVDNGVTVAAQAAGAALIATSTVQFAVWHRPAAGGAGGGWGGMTACSVSAVEGILRSRRD